MQEEVHQKTVALAFQAVRFSGTVLKKAVVAYLNKHKEYNGTVVYTGHLSHSAR